MFVSFVRDELLGMLKVKVEELERHKMTIESPYDEDGPVKINAFR